MHNLNLAAPSIPQIIFSLIIGSIAVLIVGVQPILLGALVDAHQLTLDGVGLMAMGEIVTLGLGVILGDLLPLRHFRSIAIGSGILCAIFNAATPLSTGDVQLIGMRALAGLVEGVLIWTSTCIIVRSSSPARIAGIFFIVQTLGQAGLAMLLANLILPHMGWQGGFFALSILSLAAATLALSQPVRLMPLINTADSRLKWTTTNAFPLAIIFLEQASIGALWAYFDPLGQAVGLNPQSSQNVISMVLIAQLGGGGLGTLLVKRMSALTGLTISCVMLVCVAIGILELAFGDTARFTFLAMLLGFTWVFSFPFQIKLAFNADTSGQVATLAPAAQLLGSAFGPLVASLIIVGDDARPAICISMVFGILATALLIGGWRHISQAHSTHATT